MFIRHATLDDLDHVTPLFNAYRVFYERTPDEDVSRTFLRERLENGEATILIAFDSPAEGEAMGFIQIFPSFSSVRACRTLVLNDLFVAESHRRKGVARGLMLEAAAFASRSGALRMSLETGVENRSAQALYESLGWVRDSSEYHYAIGPDVMEQAASETQA